MNKYKKNKDIKVKSLDTDIAFLKFAKSIDKVDKPLMKMIKKDFIGLSIIFSVLAILIISLLMGFSLAFPLLVGFAGCFGTYAIIHTILQDIKTEKNINKKIENGEISLEDIDTNEKFEEFLLSQELGIDTNFDFDAEEAFDFEKNYNEDYLEYLKNNKVNEEDNVKLRLVNSSLNFNLDEVKEKIIKELDIYTNAYKIPPIIISNREWDIIFEELYNSFQKKGKEKKFSDYMSLFLRRILVNGIIDKPKNIGYLEFVNSLDSILNVNVFDGVFNKKDISNIKKKLLLNYKKTRVVDLNEYRKSIGKTKK